MKGHVQAHRVRVPSTVEGRQGCRSWMQLLTSATVRKRRGMDAKAQLTASVFFFSARRAVQEMGLPCLGWVFTGTILV